MLDVAGELFQAKDIQRNYHVVPNNFISSFSMYYKDH